MHSSRLTVSLLATLLFVNAPAFAADPSISPGRKFQPRSEKIAFKFNLPKGTKKKIAYDVNSIMTFDTPKHGPQKVVVDVRLELDMVVKDIDQRTGYHKIDMTYDRVAVNSRGSGSIKYDSANKDTNNLRGQQFGVLVGKTITVTVCPEGKVKKVDGLEKLVPAGRVDGTIFDEMFTIYPAKPVAIGDSWIANRETAVRPGINMKTEMKYTLIDRINGKAIVKVHVKCHTPGLPVKGAIVGEISIDEKTGWTERGIKYMKISCKQIDTIAKVIIDGDKKARE